MHCYSTYLSELNKFLFKEGIFCVEIISPSPLQKVIFILLVVPFVMYIKVDTNHQANLEGKDFGNMTPESSNLVPE